MICNDDEDDDYEDDENDDDDSNDDGVRVSTSVRILTSTFT